MNNETSNNRKIYTTTVLTAQPPDNRNIWESYKKIRDNYEIGYENAKYLAKGSPTARVIGKGSTNETTPKPTPKPKETKAKETIINYKVEVPDDIVDVPRTATFNQMYNPHMFTRPVFTPVRTKQMTIEDYLKIANRNQERDRFETVVDEGKYSSPLAIAYSSVKPKAKRVLTQEERLLQMMRHKEKPIAVPSAQKPRRKNTKRK